ncbi:phage tail tape measure protein [Desulfonispora thiosulfatigenes]|uniref:phage tail tape measure protein n=1 Tax=Desulfonispora thiosulfatigenes TaxID=83661 RepID=UPI00117DB850|nr:phage tail tape measure protein [Desulfonispora thiosulfatigenes]
MSIGFQGNAVDEIDAVNKKMDESKEKSIELAKQYEKMGKGFESVGKKMTVGISAPIIGMGTLAGKIAIDMEDAFAGTRKTIDMTEEEFKQLEKSLDDLSADKIPILTTEIYGIAEAAGQLGIRNENILGFTDTMAKMGVATNMVSEEAATALARLANITEMSQDNFDRLGSTVVHLGNKLVTTEGEIVEMGLRLAGAGKQVGMSEADILSFAGALSSVGIRAEAGGSAFSKVMLDIQNNVLAGGEKLELFAAVAGKSSKEFAETFKNNSSGAIVSFIEGMGDLQKKGANIVPILESLELNDFLIRDALLRASGAGDLFNKSLKMGSKAWEENNALTKEAEERFKTTKSKIVFFRNQMGLLGKEIGNIILPVIGSFLSKGSEFIKNFRSLNIEAKKDIIVIAGLTAVIGPLIWTVGKGITVFAKVKKGLAAAGGIVGWLATPFGIATAVVLGLAVAGFLLYKNWNNIKTKISTIVIAIKERFVILTEWFDNFQNNISKWFIGTWNDIKNVLIENENTIKTVATTLGVLFTPALIKTGIEAVITGARIVGSLGASFIRTAFLAGWLHGKLVGELILSFIKTGWEAVKTAGVITGQFIMSLIRSGWEAIKTAGIITTQLIVSMVNYALSGWRVVYSIAATTVAWVAQKIAIVGSSLAIKTMTAAQWALNIALNANPIGLVIGLVALLAGGLVVLYQKSETARNIMNNLWEGMKNSAVSSINIIIGAINRLIGGINSIKAPGWIPVVGGKSANIANIPMLAKGTNFHRGGPAIVGEEGPELLNLRRGASVSTNKETRQAIGGGGNNVFSPVIKVAIEGGAMENAPTDLERELEKRLYSLMERYWEMLLLKRPISN